MRATHATQEELSLPCRRRPFACVIALLFAVLAPGTSALAEPTPLLASVSNGTQRASAPVTPAPRPAPMVRNPLLIAPRRAPERRVFDAMRVEPWMRGGRVGVRMSASF